MEGEPTWRRKLGLFLIGLFSLYVHIVAIAGIGWAPGYTGWQLPYNVFWYLVGGAGGSLIFFLFEISTASYISHEKQEALEKKKKADYIKKVYHSKMYLAYFGFSFLAYLLLFFVALGPIAQGNSNSLNIESLVFWIPTLAIIFALTFMIVVWTIKIWVGHWLWKMWMETEDGKPINLIESRSSSGKKSLL